ncbi:SufD family Fe-S cluster assembly protein [Sneathia sanguinegens]|uniref:SufD family Fe-S cluster assembly protein n=1 Tax=Sneathia sanguinegens TaxID=40543 RepID=A0ABT7HJ26_9FUSO|nr:SufD family Fe-S cluster assembly protein [Sneathia sanguinegens]MDK9580149.1 SufD family Fe-S cluster assembly protein [Sneathia sanguinegens]
MKKYEELQKPYWKRLKYAPTETIEQKEYNINNVTFLNMDQNGINISKYCEDRPEPYRGLGEYHEIENKQRLNNSLALNISSKLEKMIAIKFDFNNISDTLINGININMEKNSRAKLLIFYESADQNEHYHNGYIRVNLADNSELELINLQNLNGFSKNFTQTDFVLDNNVKLNYYDLELGAKINAVASKARFLGEGSEVLFIPAYLVDEHRKADFEYSLLFHGKKNNGNIEGRGATKDHGLKIFRGNIYFYRGCSKSKASEGEFSILLDDTIKIHSIPAMLCDEDDVLGAHAASVGKVNEDRLFYLMSRGFNSKEAKKIIVESSFRPIFERIEFEDIKEKMFKEINNRML